jgi:hypothetical protein
MGDPTPPRADYYILISRAAEFPKTRIWPFSVRDPLPDIPIPLKPEDGFVTLPFLRSKFIALPPPGTPPAMNKGCARRCLALSRDANRALHSLQGRPRGRGQCNEFSRWRSDLAG